jgi:hypothetical protein
VLTRDGTAGSDGGEEASAIEADQSARLAELRFRHLQILVRDINALLQHIERLVIEDFPPFAPQDLILRLSGFPTTGLSGTARRKFFERGWNLGGGPRVSWADRAGAGPQK